VLKWLHNELGKRNSYHLLKWEEQCNFIV
jgi:hypothetical protein